jgi:fibronectin type III domain protein
LTQRVGNCGANRHATAGGKAAANNSNVTRVSVRVSDRTAVSNWYAAAFHALLMLDPRLASTGYAAYYTANPAGMKPLAWNYTAAVDVYRGRTGQYNGQVIAFPANNAASPLLSYQVGTESPEPFRTSTGPCRSWGTRASVSAPVIVQWPINAASGLGGGSIVDLTTGGAVPTCTLTAASYPAGSEQRMFLGGINGITKGAFYYASSPFTAGHRYQLRVKGAVITTFNAIKLPSSVSATPTGVSKAVKLSWSAASPGVGSVRNYLARVYAGAGCSGSALVGVNTSDRSALLNGLKGGRTYWARVAAVNTKLGARWSACHPATTR